MAAMEVSCFLLCSQLDTGSSLRAKRSNQMLESGFWILGTGNLIVLYLVGFSKDRSKLNYRIPLVVDCFGLLDIFFYEGDLRPRNGRGCRGAVSLIYSRFKSRESFQHPAFGCFASLATTIQHPVSSIWLLRFARNDDPVSSIWLLRFARNDDPVSSIWLLRFARNVDPASSIQIACAFPVKDPASNS
ncbi:MAG: hypothetical protein H7Y42_19610 [Chitinophagaceae bacterium]|nr:hypothetical protein [Chitinophagaceae bacterium]